MYKLPLIVSDQYRQVPPYQLHNAQHIIWIVLYARILPNTADNERTEFIKSLTTHRGPIPGHIIRRSSVYADFINLYQCEGDKENMVLEYPMRIKYENEKAWDGGGVSRDALSQFWEETYTTLFDGGNLLTPVITPQSDLTVFPVLGRILSHGYLATGVLPVRIAFPSLAGMLLGPCKIADEIILVTFQNAISTSETETIRQALSVTTDRSILLQN